MDQCPNLRQLGGYAARCGGRVKHNLLFRAGSLAFLTDADMARLAALQLGSVIDFRRESEIELNPNRLPASLLPVQKQLPIAPGDLLQALEQGCADYMHQHMVNINASMALEQRAVFSTFLNDLLHLDGGLLFHCTAGKDRTGFAAALILMALDVPRETILQDYLLTAEYFIPEQQLPLFLEKVEDTPAAGKVTAESLLPLLSVRPAYLQAAFDAIDASFDSDSEYLTQVLDFDRNKQQQLQAKFLD